LLEHFEKAEATVGESSAVRFDDRYWDSMMHALVRGGGCFEGEVASAKVKAKSQTLALENFMMNLVLEQNWALILEYFLKESNVEEVAYNIEVPMYFT